MQFLNNDLMHKGKKAVPCVLVPPTKDACRYTRRRYKEGQTKATEKFSLLKHHLERCMFLMSMDQPSV